MAKVCLRCRENKPLVDFYIDKSKKDGARTLCKECDKIKSREWSLKNPKRRQDILRKSRTGLSSKDYSTLFRFQNYSCAICGATNSQRRNAAAKKIQEEFLVDHNHKTGAIRGLLCYPCNTLLGQAKDQTTILRSAISYLLNPPFKRIKNA